MNRPAPGTGLRPFPRFVLVPRARMTTEGYARPINPRFIASSRSSWSENSLSLP